MESYVISVYDNDSWVYLCASKDAGYYDFKINRVEAAVFNLKLVLKIAEKLSSQFKHVCVKTRHKKNSLVLL